MKTAEIYAQAAKAAEADIPAKEAEIERLRKEMDLLQTEVNHLRMIAAYGQGNMLAAPEQGELIMPDGSRQPKGQAMVRVLDILSDGKPRTHADIRNEVALKYGISYGVSTIYANLSRGKTSGQLEQTGNDQWKLAKK